MDKYNFISIGGLVALMVLAWMFSADRRRLNWRCILWGVGLQLALAVLVFRLPGSNRVFLWLNDAVIQFISAAGEGQLFLFGALGSDTSEHSVGFILAFQALPIIIFFSALMALLYHWRVMPAVIRGFAWLFTRLMRISGAESLCAASNIFVGIESSTTIRPHLQDMTRSELGTVLTAGMATVASSVLGVYVIFLSDSFPTIAGHLISASVLSAPAAIVMSKIIIPETGRPLTLGKHIELHYEREPSAVASIISGAMAGVKLVVGVAALLIALLGMLGVVNLLIAQLGGFFGAEPGTVDQWSLQMLLGYIMGPLAALIGVPIEDAMEVGRLLGERAVVTELCAYQHLAQMIDDNVFANPRSVVVATYALCGFAHVASLAVFAGGISALVPQRRADIAAVSLRALLAATLACLMTGAVAGIFYHDGLVTIVSNPAG
ncbi:MAG: hypothetical protein JW936_03200 [Sedimentisphaerales bacterium]|nr:hypothetical protein [Sedimentisphaerales bacterium]